MTPSRYYKVVHLEPSYFAIAYSNLGDAKRTLGRYAEAITDHNEGIRLNPNFAEAYVNPGVVKEALGRHRGCPRRLRRGDPPETGRRRNLPQSGYTQGRIGSQGQARTDFETALELARTADKADAVAQAERSVPEIDAGGDL